MEVEYRIYVNNIPAGTSREELNQTFRKYGNIFEIVPHAEQNTYGFITFHTKEAMDAAIREENYIGSSMLLGVSDARKREWMKRLTKLPGGDEQGGGGSTK
ncbi:hypothetical protein MKW94_005151 [Papaver nudicaule]|uniref:RRM domain-containing protein n=1 Tax=Papaver nudicaule TaxID=74823 RepID=A0AA41VGF2_PAPNU|nr:hypothetical protein [Papaver nudicaule]